MSADCAIEIWNCERDCEVNNKRAHQDHQSFVEFDPGILQNPKKTAPGHNSGQTPNRAGTHRARRLPTGGAPGAFARECDAFRLWNWRRRRRVWAAGRHPHEQQAAGCCPAFGRNQGPTPAVPRFGFPVFVRWRCADVVPFVLQSDVSVVTAILDIATLLLWSSAATVT